MAMEDEDGGNFGSLYDTVASDTTTANAMEDIDGLTQNIISAGNHIFTTLAGSDSVDTKNRSNFVAVTVATVKSNTPKSTSAVAPV